MISPASTSPRRDRVENAVVAQLDDLSERGRGEPEQQEGRRVEPRHRDAARDGIGQRRGLARDDQRPDAVPERGAGAQRPVAVAERPRAPRR